MEKTLAIHLAEQRERIAKAIEQGAYLVGQNDTPGNQLKAAIMQAADIARNEK